MSGFWLSIQSSVAPGTPTQVDRVIPLPGHGYSLFVSARTHDDVILAIGAHDDGAGGSGAALIDVGVDFVNTHGILVGDILQNVDVDIL